MRPILFILALALSGCIPATVNYMHKAGSSTADRQQAYDQCKIEAINKIPQHVKTNFNSGFSSPGTTYCNPIGNTVVCNTVGGVNVPASISTVDTNSPLRERYIHQCLSRRGFNVVQMTRCIGKKDYEGDVQPPLSKLDCASPHVRQ